MSAPTDTQLQAIAEGIAAAKGCPLWMMMGWDPGTTWGTHERSRRDPVLLLAAYINARFAGVGSDEAFKKLR